MMNLTKSERILIFVGLLMAAVMVGYNAFFVPKIDPKMEITTDVSENHAEVREESVEKININNASLEELLKINGVGNYLAKNIIDYRENNGGFADISEILNVKGIGEKFFENIKNQICV